MKLAEYIWIDGTEPTPLIRSKTKVLEDEQEPSLWGFDGSSTKQADGENSDCVLKPVVITKDPLRGGDNILVLCEVYNTDMTPHRTNTRAKCLTTHALYESDEDDMARAAQLARDHSSGADFDRQSYEEMSADLPREWPDVPELVDPMGVVPKLPGPKNVADHLYRIKKLIDELPMSYMEKLEYFNQILRGAAPEDDV